MDGEVAGLAAVAVSAAAVGVGVGLAGSVAEADLVVAALADPGDAWLE